MRIKYHLLTCTGIGNDGGGLARWTCHDPKTVILTGG